MPVWKADPVTETIEQAGIDRTALQRRTLNSLRLAQVPGQAAVAGMVAVVTLLASDILGSDRLAGIGSASFTLGAAITMVPLAAIMRRRGRRRGMAGALLIGAAGSVIAATGGQLRFFPLFVVGMVLFGAGQASTLQGRYVAADLAEPDHQATAIAAIVWIGALGAIFGPLLTPFEKAVARSIGLDELIGPFVFATFMFLVAAVVVWTRLRPDPLEVIGGINPNAERTRPIKQVRASVGVIAQSSNAKLGFAAMAISQAVMVGVMTMTPPHMKDHNHADLSAFVIAVHIVGMYGLAPFVGRAVERIGRVRSIQVGAIVLGAGTLATVLAGYVPALMFIGLFFLGLGWNIGLIGGSTLLTTSVPAESKVEVQGTSDLTMSFCGALAAFTSGFVKESFGFHLLANAAAVLAGCLLVYAWLTAARVRSTATPA